MTEDKRLAKALDQFTRGGRLGCRARAVLAKKIKCTEGDLLRALRHRRLWPPLAGVSTLMRIALGVHFTNQKEAQRG